MQWSFGHFDPTLVPALQRHMLTEPEILGILSIEEMSLLGSHRFPDACEDYSGVVSWLSFVQGIVASIFSSVWISRDLNPIFWFMYAEIGVDLLDGSILVPRLILLCISSINVTLKP